jgi:formylglycine-generating enzyme required for sulfatase activity
MRIRAVLFLCALFALPLQAEVYRSSDFGWEAGQDVSREFEDLLESGKLRPGGELVLDHTYRITGSHELPDNFTLSAMTGAGFDVIDAVKPREQGPLLAPGNDNTLRNLTIHYLYTPKLGPTGEERGVTFTTRVGIQASGKSNLRIENCRLVGSIGHHIRLRDCSEVEVIGCHIAGGHWSVYLVGVSGPVFRRCLIEKCQGDAIKTGGGSKRTGGATRGALVENCVFQDNLRDGIDTTGGFNESVVRNCIFRRMKLGMDIKSHYESKTGDITDLAPENIGIRVEKCLFHDVKNGIVFTTIDHSAREGGKALLTEANIKKYVPHDIEINDCGFGYSETSLQPRHKGGYGVNYPSEEGEHMRALYIKSAHSVRYRNMRLFNDRIRPVYVTGRYLSDEADGSVPGNVIEKAPAPVNPGASEPPFVCGPRPTGDTERQPGRGGVQHWRDPKPDPEKLLACACEIRQEPEPDWTFDADEAKRRQAEAAEALGLPVTRRVAIQKRKLLEETLAGSGIVPGKIDTADGTTMELVLIPPGEFETGSRYPAEVVRWRGSGKLKGRPSGFMRRMPLYRFEHPRQRLRIPEAFYMSRYELTRGQWAAITGLSFEGNARLPVRLKAAYATLSRDTASRDEPEGYAFFLDMLNETVGKRENLKFRLPTEAEWEYACRAGTNTPFWFGETISTDQANYHGGYPWDGTRGDVRNHLMRVGSFDPNPWGLYDTVGNVWELVRDDYGPCPEHVPGTMPAGTWTARKNARAWEQIRTVRGGNYGSAPVDCRSAYRRYLAAHGGLRRAGIRLVAEPVDELEDALGF